MTEIWKDIKNFEGLYQVSNMGNVRSLRYRRMNTIRNLKPRWCTNGYYSVSLRRDGKSYPPMIHRLVALAFLPNPHNYREVNHKDEDKKNNCVDNLEWCTSKYNACYGTRNIRASQKQSKPVKGINLKTGEIIFFKSMIEAKRKGYGHISECCYGLYKQTKGYKWEWV